MTQNALAALMDVTQATISAIELGSYPPTHKFVYAVARVWELDASALLTKAGLAAEPMPVNEQTRAELLAIFDRLDEEDQMRVIENAKSLQMVRQKLKQSRGISAKHK